MCTRLHKGWDRGGDSQHREYRGYRSESNPQPSSLVLEHGRSLVEFILVRFLGKCEVTHIWGLARYTGALYDSCQFISQEDTVCRETFHRLSKNSWSVLVQVARQGELQIDWSENSETKWAQRSTIQRQNVENNASWTGPALLGTLLPASALPALHSPVIARESAQADAPSPHLITLCSLI